VPLSNVGTFSDTVTLKTPPSDPGGVPWTATVSWPGDSTTEPASASCDFSPG